MNKKCVVRLSDEARVVCQEIIKNLQRSAQKFRRAQILLKADADGPGWADVKIAEACNCRVQTIEHLRKRLVLEQLPRSLRRNALPVQRIHRSLLVRHEHLACALVSQMEVGTTPSSPDSVLHHPPEACDGIAMVATMGW
jgi:hypothetical protein